MDKKGFALIEVIIVIAILGVLASILLPNINKYNLKSRATAHNATVNVLKTAGFMYITDNPNKISEEINVEELRPYLDKDSNIEVDPFIIKNIDILGDSKNFTITYTDDGIEVYPGIVEIEDNKLVLKDNK